MAGYSLRSWSSFQCIVEGSNTGSDGGRGGERHDEAGARADAPARTTGARPSIRPGASRRTARSRNRGRCGYPAGRTARRCVRAIRRGCPVPRRRRRAGRHLRGSPSRSGWRCSGGAYLTAFSTRCSTIWRRRGGSARPCSRTLGAISIAVAFEDRTERGDDLVDQAAEVDRHDRRRTLRNDPDGGENRVDQPVQPLDLLERRVMPAGARPAALHVARDPVRGAAAHRPAGRHRRGRRPTAFAVRG